MKIEGWKQETIGKLCKFSNGYGFGPKDWAEEGLPIIRIQNLNGSENFNYYNHVPDPSWLVQPGTLLFAWAGTKAVSFGPKVWNGPLGVLNQHIYRIHPCADVDNHWLYLALRRATDQIERKAHGFKSTLLHVSKEDITNQLLSVPPIAEQRKMADLLTSWDQSLEKFDRLIEAKKRRKQALMQQLFVHASEKAGTTHARHRLGEVCQRVTRRNVQLNDNVLTISAQRGLISQREYFARSVAGVDIKNYYLLHNGEFAYNRSTASGYPFGAIKRLDRYGEGIVSTLYICFRIKSESTVFPDYLTQYFEGGRMNEGLRMIAKEGARAHGLLNVTTEEFFGLDIFLPPLAEQQKIARVLNTCDDEFHLLCSQRAAFEQQKLGLMQRLLTGKIRVKLDDSSSE